MKRKILLALLCMLLPGAWLCPLHADTGPQKKMTRDSYIIWEAQIGDPSQLSSNSNATADGSDYINLIDNNTETIFHSIWDTDMALSTTTVDSWLAKLTTLSSGINNDPGYHNLQVMLSEPINKFRFEYKGRNSDWHDNPNHIVIYATNDPVLGASTSNADQDQWTYITELTPENTDFPEDVYVINEAWQSPIIDMPGEYQYIRFVVKGTTHMNKVDTRMFAVPEITGVTFNLSEFQIYSPREATSSADILQTLVDSIQTVWTSYKFELGTDPGYADSVKYKKTYMLWEEASSALFDVLSDDVYADYVTRLREAMTDFMATGIYPVETGYYFFVNAYPEYERLQGVTKSMRVNKNKNLSWDTTDTLDASQLWYVEKLGEGRYSIMNVASSEYIGAVEGVSKNVPMTPTHQTDQIFDWLKMYPGQFHIYNTLNDTPYHTNEHLSGLGEKGRIVTYTGSGNSCSEWYPRRVTNQELIDKLVAQGPQAILATAMESALKAAYNSREKANDYKALVTRAEQISSNAQSPGDGSAYANLIDNNTGTIFHSVWDAAFASPTLPGDSYGWHNLQFALDEPISQIRFEFTGRVESNGWTDTPNHITIYGTNDDALGASTAAADSASWVLIEDMTKDKYSFPANQSGAVYNSPIIDFGGESYKYLRFVVKHTTTMEPGNNRATSFVSPQATGVTFNLSEFQIYDPVPTAKSQYFTVPGMKEACDALEALIATSQEKLSAGTLVEADITALEAAYAKVDTLWIDRNALFNQLKSLLETSNNLYNTSTGSRIALITNVSQLSTNSDQNNPSALPNLIDGNTTTVFHSVWNDAMGTELTAQEWDDIIYENYPMSTGTGYHNLNVSLQAPVSQFFFEYYSRPDATWHDNPSDIMIYATNDKSLFDDVRDSNTSQWQFITELTEGFPTGMTTEIPYTSPIIELNGEYKYVRFVIKNTCIANNPEGSTAIGNTRNFLQPDITGITWNVSEFQMYSGLDPESIQYNYIEEVRVAADELKDLLDKYEAYTSSDINSKEPINEIEAALKKLQEAYVDTTNVVDLYAKYKELLGLVEDGDRIGDVDDYSQIETFDAILDEARLSIDPKRPTKEQVNSATEKITTGYDEFMSHVKWPQPYVWYVIRSGATREYALDQPVFLSSVSSGGQLKIGGYPAGDEWMDVYAIWRLVPVVVTSEGEDGGEPQALKPWEVKYAIQSLGTGQYWGPYRGQGAGYSPLMSNAQTPYNIYLYGMGCFKLQQEGVEDPFDCIKADGTEFVVLNYPANGDHQQAWKFEEVSPETEEVAINWFPAQSTSIVTLPWDMTGENMLKNLNPEVETYAVNSVVTEEGDDGPSYTLTLTAKDEFEAGEPFVLVTTAEPDANGQQPLWFLLPPEEANAITDTSVVTSNGLIGTLEGFNIKGQASLYFNNSVLNVCNDAGAYISGRSGYIDVTKVQDLGGSIDKTISINGIINDIQKVEIVGDGDNEKVDVYTIDGVLLKRNVKASEATKNLGKGIYIVGKKKVLVK